MDTRKGYMVTLLFILMLSRMLALQLPGVMMHHEHFHCSSCMMPVVQFHSDASDSAMQEAESPSKAGIPVVCLSGSGVLVLSISSGYMSKDGRPPNARLNCM